jgi:hypothetical protein
MEMSERKSAIDHYADYMKEYNAKPARYFPYGEPDVKVTLVPIKSRLKGVQQFRIVKEMDERTETSLSDRVGR